jgi:hypothetical protein
LDFLCNAGVHSGDDGVGGHRSEDRGKDYKEVTSTLLFEIFYHNPFLDKFIFLFVLLNSRAAFCCYVLVYNFIFSFKS